MKERPILFNGAMIRAQLAGTKKQTRRICKGIALEWLRPDGFSPKFVALPENHLCPYGAPGDRLWVRESFAHIYRDNKEPKFRSPEDMHYMADGFTVYEYAYGPWKPSIHMPRWASRITLEVTGVRVERLKDISEADAIAEGIVPFGDGNGWHTEEGRHYAGSAVDAYLNLWSDINGPGSVDSNPWVWVVEFRRIESERGPSDGALRECGS